MMRTMELAIFIILGFGIAATALAEWRYGPSGGPLPVAWKWLFDRVPWWLGLAIMFIWVALWSGVMGR
jgi:hypothetical protein